MHFHYFCGLLYIWHVGFQVFIFWKFEKCIYFVIYLYVFKLVCTRWKNFIRIWITVLYLKSCRCQLWTWRFQISVLLISINSENQLSLFLKQNKLFYDIQKVMFTMTKTPYLSGNGKTTLLLVKLFIVMYFFVSPSGDLHILFYYTV